MAQLWGGRFTKETDKLVYNFNASIGFDQKFFAQDIRGSMAHVTMLAKQGILTMEEKTRDHRWLRQHRTRCWKWNTYRLPKNMKIFTAL